MPSCHFDRLNLPLPGLVDQFPSPEWWTWASKREGPPSDFRVSASIRPWDDGAVHGIGGDSLKLKLLLNRTTLRGRGRARALRNTRVLRSQQTPLTKSHGACVNHVFEFENLPGQVTDSIVFC